MKLTTMFRVAFMTVFILCVMGEESVMDRGAANPFSANVKTLLDLLIGSLYTNRDIFLRELISNGSDALDKIRFLYLTNPKEPKNDAGEAPTMDIRIHQSKADRTITIRDGGIGLTKDEMAKNLGTLGTSGTKEFLEKLKESKDEKLIGQFGVGFYSAFLVATKVRVASKSDDSDKQWVWESEADGNFYLYEDERGNTLGRGTEITLELRADADEYLDNDKIKDIVHHYSEFIHFPIYLRTEKKEKVPKKTAEENEQAPAGDEEGNVEDKNDQEQEMEEVTVYDWQLINENKPIWTRSPKEIKEEEYNKFYKSLTKDYDDPMYYTHFSAEGEVTFKALLFVPGRAPYNTFDTAALTANIRLYVRRVFITDEFKDLLPRYLNFIKGIVDSDDLPLNVSREVLQENRILKIIKRKLVRKALGMLQEIADNDKAIEKKKAEKEENGGEEAEEEEKSEDDDDDDSHGGKKQKDILFPKFWEEFGKNLRLGMIEDGSNRARLTKLLRYKSSKSEDKYVSLEDYVDRMPESQKAIYFLAAESMDKIKQSPVLEDALQRDVEVLFMTDAIDEYVVSHVTDFADKKLVNLAKEDGALSDSDSHAKKVQKKRAKKYEPLTKWMKDTLGPEKAMKVILTQRKTNEAIILSTPAHGVSANMARIMRGQALGDKQGETDTKRTVEVNHRHPLIDEIFKRITVDEKDQAAADIAMVLYDISALQNGFDVKDTLALSKRMNRMLRSSVDIASDAPLLEDDPTEFDAEIAEESTEEAKEEEGGEEEESSEEGGEEESAGEDN